MTFQPSNWSVGEFELERKDDQGTEIKGKTLEDIATAAAAAIDGIKSDFEAFKESNDRAWDALKEGKPVDVLIEEKTARIDDSIQKHQDALQKLELALKRNPVKYLDAKGNEIDVEAKAREFAEHLPGLTAEERKEFKLDDAVVYQQSLNKMLLRGEARLTTEEMKSLSAGSNPDGGYVVTPDTSGRIVEFVRETSIMRAYASVTSTAHDSLEGLVDIDQAGYEWVGETTAPSDTSTPQLEVYKIPLHELSAMPKATQRLLEDADMDIEGWLAAKVADRFARAENNSFVVGNGIAKPRGFLDYGDWASAGVHERGALEQFDTGVNGGFAAAPNGGDVLINTIYGLKAKHRANATWFLNRATTGLVRKLKDSNGAYLWQPGIAAGQPATILGYGMASFEDMPDPATGSLSMAFGDMRSTYQIVDRRGTRIVRDIYTAKPYVLFWTSKRVGGDVIDFDALKVVCFQS